ncbi:NLR family CARD domain-containing protein 4-like [Antedon mediterranea]|uniref:NLR family CARD domain-containing protein 4-like n=1 Tax=Antedon mediterranea TaxID=105859 RepID=UPI003AF6565B
MFQVVTARVCCPAAQTYSNTTDIEKEIKSVEGSIRFYAGRKQELEEELAETERLLRLNENRKQNQEEELSETEDLLSHYDSLKEKLKEIISKGRDREMQKKELLLPTEGVGGREIQKEEILLVSTEAKGDHGMQKEELHLSKEGELLKNYERRKEELQENLYSTKERICYLYYFLFTEQIETYLLNRHQWHNINKFTPKICNPDFVVDVNDVFSDLEFWEKKRNEPITLDGMLNVIKSKPACKVLIESEMGTGKTTLLRYLAYNAKETIKALEGKIVFLLNARELDTNKSILDLMVKQLKMKDFSARTNLPHDSNLIKRFIVNHVDKVVVMLDGLEELRFKNTNLITMLRKENLEKSIVILTTRSGNLDEFIKVIDIHVRVAGFSEDSIGKYVDKHFGYFGKPELGNSLRKELGIGKQVWNRKHPEIFSLCNNPMFLLTVCILWEDMQCLPHNKADVAKVLFINILNQFEKEKYPKISKFKKIPLEYENAMILLGKSMFNSLKVNQTSINKRDLNANKDIVDLALKLGFVYRHAPIGKSNFEVIYMPLHKLIGESLVGFYLCKLCEAESVECTKDTQELLTQLSDDDWQMIRESEHLEGAKQFAINFLDGDADKLLKHWITDNVSYQDQFFRSCYMTVSADCKGRVLAHILGLANVVNFDMHNSNLTGDVMNETIRECSYRGFELTLHALNISDNYFSDIDGVLLGKFLSTSPNLIKLGMHDCQLSGNIMNYMILTYKGNELRLQELDIGNNDISDIDGTSLGTYLSKCPKLVKLRMYDCKLSGNVMNEMMRAHARDKLELQELDIRNNDISDIDGALLGTYLSKCPKLVKLYMDNCKLSGNVMYIMMIMHSRNELELQELNFTNNDISGIDGALLGTYLSKCPKLIKLYMVNCELSSNVMNEMMRVHARDKLELQELDIRNNDISDIDNTLLGTYLSKCPKLVKLRMYDCNLSGDVAYIVVRECNNRRIMLLM